MEEYFTVLGFSDNSEVIPDREEGAVLVLEKPSFAADSSDVKNYSDFGDNCIPVDDNDTIAEFLEHMKTQKMAGNLRSGPEALEIRDSCSEMQENEKMEEADPGNSLILEKVSQMTKQSSICRKKLANVESKKKKFWLCERCGKKCGSKVHLNQHLQTHNPTNDFVCQFCGKAFKTSGYRYQHEQQRSAPMVRCGICGKEYKNRFSLKTHQLYMHLNQKISECQICNKILSCKRALREHEKKIHKLN
jgi:hypothetical protein